jgi:hypothetical protein
MQNKTKWPMNQIVEVFWVDSCSRGRWAGLDDYRKERPAICKTCGYLVAQTKTYITIALSQGDMTAMSNNVLDSISIPRSCVTRIRRLK